MAQLEDLIPEELSSGLEYVEVDSTPVEFRTGAAGSGKTFGLKKAIEEDSSYGTLAATTGIAPAINLGAVTLNALLKFFDTDSLRDRFTPIVVASPLLYINWVRKTRNLIIDEVSMMDGRQLDYIHKPRWHR